METDKWIRKETRGCVYKKVTLDVWTSKKEQCQEQKN